MNEYTVLSLFDGMSCGRIALDRAGVPVGKYYASEIDPPAIKVAQANWPENIQLGSVTEWREWDIDWSSIDLLMGGSPCQGFSFAGNMGGTKAILDGKQVLVTDRETYLDMKAKGAEFLSQSYLFWEYVLCLDHARAQNPNIKFMLENVKMKAELLDMISDALGVQPIRINSNLVSAQNRDRFYWCNWDVTQPEDKGIMLADILEENPDPKYLHTAKAVAYMNNTTARGIQKWAYTFHSESRRGKSSCVVANFFKGQPNNVLVEDLGHDATESDFFARLNPETGALIDVGPFTAIFQRGRGKNPPGLRGKDGKSPTVSANGWQQNNFVFHAHPVRVRKFTEIEAERLQTVPDNYTNHVCKTQRYRMIGNGWTVDVIAHLLSSLPVKNVQLYVGAIRGRRIEPDISKVTQCLEVRATAQDKSNCLTTVAKDNVLTTLPVGRHPDAFGRNLPYREYTPVEYERLQTIPDGYSAMVSDTQRKKMVGNAWTVDVVAHLFSTLNH